MRKSVWAGLTAIATMLTGCAGFFVANTSTSTTTTSSGDYAYVVNNTTDTLSGFVVGTGTLTSISTYTLTNGLAPSSVAVSRPNTFVYVGGNGAISCYSIGTGGALTSVSATCASQTANFVSLATSPDGQWLLALDNLTQTVYVYKINTSTGLLTLSATTVYAAPGVGAATPRSIRIAPNGAFVGVALGLGGDVIFNFTTSTGVLSSPQNLAVASGYSDNEVVFDTNSAYALVARTGPSTGASGVATYSVASTGALTGVQTLAASGDSPYSLLEDSTGAYVYTANRGSSTISGYAFASGTLTALASSPYTSGASVIALARDNSGKYVVAASSGGSSDLTLYSFDLLTAGKLDAVAVSASGTDPAGSLALATTH